jgi:hypothetical protein
MTSRRSQHISEVALLYLPLRRAGKNHLRSIVASPISITDVLDVLLVPYLQSAAPRQNARGMTVAVGL